MGAREGQKRVLPPKGCPILHTHRHFHGFHRPYQSFQRYPDCIHPRCHPTKPNFSRCAGPASSSNSDRFRTRVANQQPVSLRPAGHSVFRCRCYSRFDLFWCVYDRRGPQLVRPSEHGPINFTFLGSFVRGNHHLPWQCRRLSRSSANRSARKSSRCFGQIHFK